MDKDLVTTRPRIKGDRKISSGEMLNILFQQKKYDVMLIKIFDRVHNLQTLGVKKPRKIQKIVKETIRYFVAFSTYWEIPKTEEKKLINLCYKYLLNPQI